MRDQDGFRRDYRARRKLPAPDGAPSQHQPTRCRETRSPASASAARAPPASCHAAAPPSRVMKSRRFRPITEFSSLAVAVDHTSRATVRSRFAAGGACQGRGQPVLGPRPGAASGSGRQELGSKSHERQRRPRLRVGGPHRGNSLSFTHSVGKEALAERRFGGAIPYI